LPGREFAFDTQLGPRAKYVLHRSADEAPQFLVTKVLNDALIAGGSAARFQFRV
jgi:hypothetical protein